MSCARVRLSPRLLSGDEQGCRLSLRRTAGLGQSINGWQSPVIGVGLMIAGVILGVSLPSFAMNG